MVGSYFTLRLDNTSNSIVIILTLSLIILPPLSIYWLMIRPRSLPKLFGYLSFVLWLGAAYLIIPASQKEFFNQILVWLIPILEISIIIIVVCSIVKSVIRYKTNDKNKQYHFLVGIRKTLAPKLGMDFIFESVITELSVIYYSILIWFRKPSVDSKHDSYTYHKNHRLN